MVEMYHISVTLSMVFADLVSSQTTALPKTGTVPNFRGLSPILPAKHPDIAHDAHAGAPGLLTGRG